MSKYKRALRKLFTGSESNSKKIALEAAEEVILIM
jgi:hypothetical protein